MEESLILNFLLVLLVNIRQKCDVHVKTFNSSMEKSEKELDSFQFYLRIRFVKIIY